MIDDGRYVGPCADDLEPPSNGSSFGWSKSVPDKRMRERGGERSVARRFTPRQAPTPPSSSTFVAMASNLDGRDPLRAVRLRRHSQAAFCAAPACAVVRRIEGDGRVGRERPHPQARRPPLWPAPGVAHVPLVGEVVIISCSGDVHRDLLPPQDRLLVVTLSIHLDQLAVVAERFGTRPSR